MKQQFLMSVSVLAVALSAIAQPSPTNAPAALYENFGIIDTTQPSPQIDALVFANYGTFSVTGSPSLPDYPFTQNGIPRPSTVVPYGFQNTLSFTNTGSMSSASGFRFETAFPTLVGRPASSFLNAATASIFGSTYVLISATNVFNAGTLTAGSDGEIQIKGQDVNLARAGLQDRKSVV